MSAPRWILPLCSVALAAGCGDDTARALKPVEFDMTVPVAASAEVHSCQFVRMPSSGAQLFVGGGSYEATAGIHHFLLFRTATDMPQQRMNEPVDCYEGDSAMRYERGFVSGGQLESDSAAFPSGLGLAFAPGEVLLFQTHALNATTKPLTARVHVELQLVEPSGITDRVGTFRFYDPFIYVAPRSHAKASMRCHIHHDVTLLSGGAHMHARGVNYTAFLDPGGAFAKAPFYTTTDWQHPNFYEGFLPIKAGSAIRFGCDYANTSDQVFIQGLSADTNEMCMFSGFYYPAGDADDEDCTSMDMHGTGARSCAQTASCLSLCPPAEEPHFSEASADVGACFQECITDSCPNVTETLFPQLTCTQERCAKACEVYGQTCSACLEQNCKPELDACLALSCGP